MLKITLIVVLPAAKEYFSPVIARAIKIIPREKVSQ